MAGLVSAIHDFGVAVDFKAWMPGTRPGMTGRESAAAEPPRFSVPN